MGKEAGAGVHVGVGADEFVAFFGAGQAAIGAYRCSECGYGVSVQRVLPRCPMCGGSSWERAHSRLSARAPSLQ